MVSEQLRGLKTVEDLSRFFGALQYTVDDRPYGTRARIIARWRGFRVVGATGHDAIAEARRIARMLSSDGGRALAVGLEPERELALAAPRLGTAGCTRVLSIPLAAPSPDALHHLTRFAPHTGSTALRHALRVNELLASEVVSERFFVRFREIHGRMTSSLGRTGSDSDRSMIALLALTRVLFLYFVQAKGWLDNRADYLRFHLDNHLSANTSFQQRFLNRLFFDTLNRPLDRRRGPKHFGQIPYLNGGLFERHPAEVRHPMARFENDLWREAFDSLFERFRFCIREAEHVDAIAPDMLGHVFERVMADHSRRTSGTYYTPETVVRQLVRATVETALIGSGGGLPAELVSAALHGSPLHRSERSRVYRAVRKLRVLDPAVGSGAFLIGALELLSSIYGALASGVPTPEYRIRARKRIIRTQLFGIDINPVAVRLAELRIWLAVIANDPETAIERIEPLPNLDGVVRQGDALVDPVGAAQAAGTHCANVASRLFADVRVSREAVFTARAQQRSAALRRMRLAELRLATALLESSLENTNRLIRDLLSAARGRDLFGHRRGLTRQQEAMHEFFRRQRQTTRRTLADVREGVIPFFAFEVHLADVMGDGGFPAVVGNPPWVRAERLSSRARKTLRERFSWWSAPPARGYAHFPDLSVVFLQRALELAASNGVVGFLLPSKVATASYGQHARAQLVRECTIEYVRRIPDSDAAQFRATTYPLAIVIRKRKASAAHRIKLDFDGQEQMDQESLLGEGPWILLPNRVRDAVQSFCAAAPSLGRLAPASMGIKTGANWVFVGRIQSTSVDGAVVEIADSTLELSWNEIRLAIRGSDIRAFRLQSRRALLWGLDSSGTPHTRLSQPLERHFRRHRSQLINRADYQRGPLWTLFRVRAATAQHRVVWRDIVQRPCAAVIEESGEPNAVPLNSCYVSAAPDRTTALVIAAVLNTTWTRALTIACGDEARGGYRRCNARVADAIPIPTRCQEDLARLSLEAHHGTIPDQHELDDAVADALALSGSTRQSLRECCRLDG